MLLFDDENPMSVDVQSEPDFNDELYSDVISGLNQDQKEIPCKYLYDDRGSQLFNDICELEEYYPTNTEIDITKQHSEDIAAHVGSGARLVELGAGSGLKTRIVLSNLHDVSAYIPVEISEKELERCVDRLSSEFPNTEIIPVCADFMGDWEVPKNGYDGRTVFYYPGSTIGNLHPDQARVFMEKLSEMGGPRSALLIGVDLDKDREIIEPAYNDSEGVTAEFTLNLLRRLNRECGADFDRDNFEHNAVYQDREDNPSRVQTRIVSTRDQTVNFPDESIDFQEGEYIVVEHSYKYSIDEFAELAEQAQWRTRSIWTDDDQLFSLWFLETGEENGSA